MHRSYVYPFINHDEGIPTSYGCARTWQLLTYLNFAPLGYGIKNKPQLTKRRSGDDTTVISTYAKATKVCYRPGTCLLPEWAIVDGV